MTSAQPIWFGEPDLPLFGWLHRGSGPVRAGVVICPPIGRELIPTYAGLRVLAEELADRGLAVLRFDYAGTGNAGGDFDLDNLVARWIDSIRVARAELSALGCSWIGVVGIRLGALLAAAAEQGHAEFDAFVAWAPYRSGRAFLREQRGLLFMRFGERPPSTEEVDLPGFVVPAAAAADISALSGTKGIGQRAGQALLVLPVGASAREAWEAASPGADILEQEDLHGMISSSDIPLACIGGVVDWIDATAPSVRLPTGETIAPERVTIAPATAARPAVVESVVRLGSVGLFGIQTELEGLRPEAPTLLLLPTGRDHTIGPSREWVRLARILAGEGMRSVRVDLSGLGDSPTRSGQPRHLVYAPEALDDAVEAVDDLRGRGYGPIVVAGLCSGAYTAIEIGLTHSIDGVVAINPVLDPDLRRMQDDETVDRQAFTGTVDRQAFTPRSSLLRVLGRSNRLRLLSRRLPSVTWAVLHHTRLQRYPASSFSVLIERRISTLVACGIGESRQFRRSAPLLRRLSATPYFEFAVIDGLDHILLDREPRERFQSHLEQYLRRTYLQVPDTTRAGVG